MNPSNTIIGTMRWGCWGKNLSPKEASTLIQECYDIGWNAFDLADIYGNYTTEELFGKALALCGIKREQLFLISKCGILHPGGSSPYHVKAYDLSCEHITNSVNRSLEQLGVNYLDLLLIHRPSPLMNFDEVANTANNLIKSGKIKHFGVSNFTTQEFHDLNQKILLHTNQIEVSLNQTQAFFNHQLHQLHNCGVQAQAWSPLGDYFSDPNSDQNNRIRETITPLQQKYNAKEHQILIAFLRQHPNPILPVIGSTNLVRLKEIKQTEDLVLELEDWFKLLEASRGHRVA